MPRDTRHPFDHRPDSDRYLPTDRLPLPEVQECDSETAWAEFERLHAQDRPLAHPVDTAFAPTVPASLPLPSTAQRTSHARAPQALTLQDVMTEARRFNRVCPLPGPWQALYDLLPGKIMTGRAWQPPPPISGPAWQATSAMPKRMCLRDHIEWAEHHGALEAVMRFLQALPESQWHHLDD